MSSTTLSQVWKQIETYISDNLSIIPIRDKDSEDGKFVAKSPYGYWTEFQKRRITKDELWHKMENNNTTAVGIVCGSVSDNLEVIDIDVKYQPGIDAILFADIQRFYPELWAILRLHKTPSGGYHVLYRIDGVVPDGNRKLAGRLATDEEKQQYRESHPQVKKELKEVNFLETRGEGGYIAAPPSLNYHLHTNNEIPLLTYEQRCSLIELCCTYNQIIKQEPAPKSTAKQDEIYDVNPFTDFNNRCDPTALVEEFDWKFSRENANFIWYTRPGKSKGVSLSWNKTKLIFYSFSASTELDAPRGYNASTFLSIYKFDGDNKKTYQYLVNNGYGVIKTKVEQAIIKSAALSSKKPLPQNISDAAKELFENTITHLNEVHPHGIFWELDDEDKLKIDRVGLYAVAEGLGFCTYRGDVLRIIDGFIYRNDPRYFYDTLKEYINEEDAVTYKDICNCYEAFIQRSGEFTIARIAQLDTENILEDTPNTAYKFYKNGCIKITSEKMEAIQYAEIKKLIWHHKILQRNWDEDNFTEICKYKEFLDLAIGIDDQLKKVIGYLSHDYKDENTGYIITLTEKCPDPKSGGGSGKNIFGNLFRNTTTVCTVAGSQVQFNEKLLQSWNGERIFFMADVPKKFDFGYLKEMSTGYGIVKKLWKNDLAVSPNEMPKLLVNSNFSFDPSDGGLKRRIIPVEFTDFFTRCGGIDTHFNCMFPTSNGGHSGWTDKDWMGYDVFIAQCIQEFFKANGKIMPGELSTGGWEKQFKQLYGELTYKFILERFNEWVALSDVNVSDFNQQYDMYCHENNISKHNSASSILMNKALKEYCNRYNYDFEPIVTISENSIKRRVKQFLARE